MRAGGPNAGAPPAAGGNSSTSTAGYHANNTGMGDPAIPPSPAGTTSPGKALGGWSKRTEASSSVAGDGKEKGTGVAAGTGTGAGGNPTGKGASGLAGGEQMSPPSSLSSSPAATPAHHGANRLAYPEYYQSSKGGSKGERADKGEGGRQGGGQQQQKGGAQQHGGDVPPYAGLPPAAVDGSESTAMGGLDAGGKDLSLMNGPIPEGFTPLATGSGNAGRGGGGGGDGGMFNERKGSGGGGGGGMGGGFGDDAGEGGGASRGGRNWAAELAAAEAAIEELQRDCVQYQLNSRNLSREVESLRAQLAEAIMQVRGRVKGSVKWIRGVLYNANLAFPGE